MKITTSIMITILLARLCVPIEGFAQGKRANDDWKKDLPSSFISLTQSLLKWEKDRHLDFGMSISTKRREVIALLNNDLKELKSQSKKVGGDKGKFLIQIERIQHLISQISDQPPGKELKLTASDLAKITGVKGKTPEEIDKLVDGKSVSYNGRLYKLITQNRPNVIWEDAKENCEALGGRLAILRDDKIRDRVSRRLLKEDNVAWIGGRWDKGSDQWEWLDEGRINTTKFHKSFVNIGKPEGKIYVTVRSDGELGNANQNHQIVLGFIIEWKLDN